jgi:hypothetical protein
MATTLTTTPPATTLHGLDTRKMVATVDALRADPTLAKFEFRARNRWISGGENRSTIKDFHGAGAEDTSRHQAFEFTNGEPPVLLGDNEGIEIEALSTKLVGDIDLQGLLALGDVPAGYQGIRVEMAIKAKNASDADLDDLLQFAQAHSPVCNTICRPVPVVVERVKS